MFEGLKKKFSSFIDSLSKKEEGKDSEPEQKQQAAVIQEPSATIASADIEPVPKEAVNQRLKPEPPHPVHEIPKERPRDKAQAVIHEQVKAPEKKTEVPLNIPKKEEEIPARQLEKHVIQEKKEEPATPQKLGATPAPNAPKARIEAPAQVKIPASSPIREDVQVASQRKEQHQGAKIDTSHEKTDKAPQVSTFTRIKGIFLGHVKISEKDADPFIEDLKMGLLQSDVNYDVTERITDNIRRNLVGREVSSRSISEDIRAAIKESILGVLSSRSKIQIIDKVKEKAAAGQLPYRILFVGRMRRGA